MDSDLQLHHHQYGHGSQQFHFQHQPQQQPLSSGLTRYRSAPSSYFSGLLNSGLSGENSDEFLNPRPSSPETQRILARFMSGGGTGDSTSHNLSHIQQNSSANIPMQSQFTALMKHEAGHFYHQDQHLQQQSSDFLSASQIYQNQSQPSLPDHDSAGAISGMDNSYGVASSMPMDRLPQVKIGRSGHTSSLIRQSSSPAGLFSNFNIEHGYGVMRGMENLGGGDGTNAEASFPSANRLKGQGDFSSGQPSSSGRMAPISEDESKSMELNGPGDESFGRGQRKGPGYITGFPIGSWDDSAIISDSFLKGLEDEDRKTFSGMNASENQNAEGGNRPPTVLSHHLSLPTSSAEVSAMEKLLQFQDSVPCNVRAKRGFATHPRSIAERVRRNRISERMRKLQELVPNMDKQTNTSDMLDLAVDYIKDLQNHLKTLSENRARCTCSNKAKVIAKGAQV